MLTSILIGVGWLVASAILCPLLGAVIALREYKGH